MGLGIGMEKKDLWEREVVRMKNETRTDRRRRRRSPAKSSSVTLPNRSSPKSWFINCKGASDQVQGFYKMAIFRAIESSTAVF